MSEMPPEPEQPQEFSIPTVADVVARHFDESEDEENRAQRLIDALIEREDRIADALRIAGTNLGTFPELVAKVLADVGLGSPVDAETKALLDMQFVQRVNWLNEQFRRNQGGGEGG
jgi:hypothetical protein